MLPQHFSGSNSQIEIPLSAGKIFQRPQSQYLFRPQSGKPQSAKNSGPQSAPKLNLQLGSTGGFFMGNLGGGGKIQQQTQGSPKIGQQIAQNNSLPEFLFPRSILQQQNKIVPKHIKMDKEKMYQDNIILKRTLNECTEENQQLKAKILALKKDNDRLQKVIGDVEGYLMKKQDGQGKLNENLLIVNLRGKIKDYQKKVQELQQELTDFKKSEKVNRISELEIELAQYLEENRRLRSMQDLSQKKIQQLMEKQDLNFNQQKQQQLNDVINHLIQENDQLKSSIKALEDEIFRLQTQKEIDDRQTKKRLKVIEEKNQRIKERDELITNLKTDLHNLYEDKNVLLIKAQRNEEEEEKLQEARKKCSQLAKIINEKEERIQYQQKQMQEQEKKLGEKQGNELREKKQLQEEYNKMREMVEEQKQKLDALMLNSQRNDKIHHPKQDDKKHDTQIQKNVNTHEVHNGTIIHKSKQGQLLRLAVVKKSDVQKLGTELKMRMRNKKLTLDKALDWNLFTDDIKKKGMISIRQIHTKFKEEPFLVRDHNMALLLARYLVEDNEEDFIIFDEDLEVTVPIVKSRIRNLIGPFKIFSQQEEQTYHSQLIPVISKHRENIQNHLDQVGKHVVQTGKVTPEELEESIAYIDIQELINDPDLHDYFFLKLFESSNTIEYYHVRDIFEIFKERYKVEIRGNKRSIKKPDIKQKDKDDNQLNTILNK